MQKPEHLYTGIQIWERFAVPVQLQQVFSSNPHLADLLSNELLVVDDWYKFIIVYATCTLVSVCIS